MPSPPRSRPPARPRWELSRDALDRLLQALGDDPETASRRYEALRRRLIDLFAWEQREAPEDLADETLNRLARRLSEGVTVEGDVSRYAFGIARLLLLEESRARRSRETALRELPLHRGDPAAADLLDRLHRCLDALPAENRRFIERYYTEERESLARSMGISVNALRNRALRLRQQLHDCVTRKRDV